MTRWKKTCLWSLMLALVVSAASHRILLRAVVNGLIADDAARSCDTLIVVSGDRNYAVAADWFAAGKARQILLCRDRLRPLVACGIVEAREEILRKEIVGRKVPEQAIAVTDEITLGTWQIADRVRERRIAQPHKQIVILSDLLMSRRMRFALARTLSTAESAGVKIVALRDRRYDETNWWRSRTGIREVTLSYLRFIHNAVVGRPDPRAPADWSPKAFEERLLEERLRSAGAT